VSKHPKYKLLETALSDLERLQETLKLFDVWDIVQGEQTRAAVEDGLIYDSKREDKMRVWMRFDPLKFKWELCVGNTDTPSFYQTLYMEAAQAIVDAVHHWGYNE